MKLCYSCGKMTAYPIDTVTKEETEIPYRIYFCGYCGNMFYKYLKEEEND